MKIMYLFKRRAGITPQQFREEYEKHAPEVMKLLPFFKKYTRNYVRPEQAHRPEGETPTDGPAFDVVTEMTFESAKDYERMTKALSDPEIFEKVVGDTRRYMDKSYNVRFFVDEVSLPQ